jgi:hypothetical protein
MRNLTRSKRKHAMKLDLNIHINSWLQRNNRWIDEDLIQLKGNIEEMIVATTNRISIRFDYPLTHSVILQFNGKTPWRLSDLLDSIAEGYVKIYDEEDETRTLPAQAPLDSILVNRPKTDGKHGIWGHILNDLFIEGVCKGSDDVWTLEIGS